MKNWTGGKILVGIFLGVSVAGANSTVLSPNRQVSVSTSTATQLLAEDVSAKRTLVVNNTDFSLYVNTASTGFSISATTGTFYIPARTSWSPDSSMHPYTGSLYAIVVGTSVAQGIGVQRSK